MTHIVWNIMPTNTDEARRRRDHDAFMMDFENWVLTLWDARNGIPTGPRRFENEAWAVLMQSKLEFADTCWDDYVEWVKCGGGDDWFVEEPIIEAAEREAAFLEAQSKMRTAYVCRDLVRPLQVSLYERIPALAAMALQQK
jgi:hypothetical protein